MKCGHIVSWTQTYESGLQLADASSRRFWSCLFRLCQKQSLCEIIYTKTCSAQRCTFMHIKLVLHGGLVLKLRHKATQKWLITGMFSSQSDQTFCLVNQSRGRRKQLKTPGSIPRFNARFSIIKWLTHVFPPLVVVACLSGYWRLLWLVVLHYVWVWFIGSLFETTSASLEYSCWEKGYRNKA